MHTALENILASSSQQTSFGFGSLSFAQTNVGSLTWVSIGAIAVGFGLALILARIWSIKAIPKAIFTLFFVALFSSLIGLAFRSIQTAEPTSLPGQWVTLVYNIKTEDKPDKKPEEEDNPANKSDEEGSNQPTDALDEITNPVLERLRRTFPNGDFVVGRSGNNQITVSFPSGTDPSPELVKGALAFGGELEFRIAASHREDRHAKLIELSQDSKSNVILDPQTNAPLGEWLNCSGSLSSSPSALITRHNPENPKQIQALVFNDKYSVVGEDLDHAYETYDENARPAIGFSLNQAGAVKFEKLTTKYAKGNKIPDEQKNHLTIILDNTVQSAPSINEPIVGGSGIINGIELNHRAFVTSLLSNWRFPIPLEPKSILEKTGPAPERIVDEGNRLTAIVITAVLFFVFLVSSFLLAKKRPRDEIPLAQLSPIA